MQIDGDVTGDVIRRLRRAERWIRSVIALMEERRDCADVVTHLAKVSRALDRLALKIVASGVRQCLTDQVGESQSLNLERMAKLLLSLALGQKSTEPFVHGTLGRAAGQLVASGPRRS